MGWGVHPLQRAAFARRTPAADIELGMFNKTGCVSGGLQVKT